MIETLLETLSKHFNPKDLTDIRRGIEKEHLRVMPDGRIALDAHPKALGSALCHPMITTDFSESLVEIVTTPHQGVNNVLAHLQQLQQVVYQHIGDQLLWPSSMPGLIADEQQVNIAEYGQSHIAKMKHTYRVGLWHRYGRIMQAIAGIHYNLSFPPSLFKALQQYRNADDQTLEDFQSAAYMRLVRQYFRHFWLLPYLFGASPVCTTTSIPQAFRSAFQTLGRDTHFAPYATSLRMSGLGYQNSAQSGLNIAYDSVANYAQSLLEATQQVHPAFQALGVNVNGQYQQLNDAILQIENEYYSPIRPKQIAESGERPGVALCRRGVAYVEVRVLDLNPLLPLGIDAGQMAFMDIFLLYCLLTDNCELCHDACRQATANFDAVVWRGRDPQLKLKANGKDRLMRDWGAQLFDEFEALAEWADRYMGGDTYRSAVAAERRKLQDSLLTSSAQVLEAVRDAGGDLTRFSLMRAAQQKADIMAEPLTAEVRQDYQRMAEQSWLQQRQVEAADSGTFEEFLARYYRQGCDGGN